MSQKRESYPVQKLGPSIKLRLNANESECVVPDVIEELAGLPSTAFNGYPSLEELTDLLSKQLKVPADRVVVTAGGDQAIERIIRTSLSVNDKNTILVHEPSFKMIEIYANNCDAKLESVHWFDQPFPIDEFVSRITQETALAVVVTPNNPTGATLTQNEISDIAFACEGAGINLLVDLAYVEFAEVDPTEQLAQLPNVIMVRSFSKAFGLAGLRVGYLIAPNAEVAEVLRTESGPYPVSGPSIALAQAALSDLKRKNGLVDSIRIVRQKLTRLIADCGGKPMLSEANFVLAKFENGDAVTNSLAEQGIAVRKFDPPGLKDYLRITCPTNMADDLHLSKALIRATGANIEPRKLTTLEGFEEEIEPPVFSGSSFSQDPGRVATVSRKTKETDIRINLNLDGTGDVKISTGIGFLDHMLTAFAFHAKFDLELTCVGDLHIDDHHTAEDCALALGAAIDQALGERKGIVRFGYAYAPLDEALARTVVDLSGRPWPEVDLALEREMVGAIATENLTHVFNSLAMALRCSLHVDVIRGCNDHHRAEAAFKSLALAMRKAVSRTAGNVPSTKGVL